MTQQTLTAVPMPLDALQNADLRAHRQLWHADAAAEAVQAYTLHHEGVNERGEALINEVIDRRGWLGGVRRRGMTPGRLRPCSPSSHEPGQNASGVQRRVVF